MSITVEGMDQFTIEGEGHDPYLISVVAYPGEDGGPMAAIYLTDGDLFFQAAAQMLGMLRVMGDIPPVCLVGVGYPIGNVFTDPDEFRNWLGRRQGDLSPVSDPDFYGWTGGGSDMLDLMKRKLIPEIESRYDVSSDDRTILGHSLGADFAIYAALAEGSPFAHCVAGSPAMFRVAEQEQVLASIDRIGLRQI